MRSEEQIFELIISVANGDENIRAVMLTGSRANQNIKKDGFQDFDVIYMVDNLDKFADDINWINVFGERIIMQMPGSMQLDEHDLESDKVEITYLMLFRDFNRIDLKLIDIKNEEYRTDSFNRVLLDKDSRFSSLPE
ncbi:MAG: aminoglycoside 6-adenylyltransferase, partial [Saprospiraceae bacterium]|nr:aminoglycoside 6-adenylyltransferase [Saprospiraceae bacterium]